MTDDRKARLAALAARAGRNQGTALGDGHSVVGGTLTGSVDSSIVDLNKEEGHQGTSHSQHDNETNNLKVMKFRNYTPKDSNLNNDEIQQKQEQGDRFKKRYKINDEISQSVPMSSSSSSSTKPQSELEKALIQAKADAELSIQNDIGDPSQLQSITTAETKVVGTNIDGPSITSIAPKKVNWDLKRDIAKKLHKLERRTQKAIVELLRERLEKEAEEEGNDDDEEEEDLD